METAAAKTDEPIRSKAEIVKINFQGKNNFCIVKGKILEGKAAGKISTFKGPIHPCVVGYHYEFVGTPHYEPKFSEWQLIVKEAHILDTLSRNGIYNYLVKEGPQIGDRRAYEITMAFGDKSLDIIENNPEQLVQKIRGMTPERAEELSTWIKGEKKVMRLKKFLYEQGLTQSLVLRIIGHFGFDAPKILREDVFRLTEVAGIGFKIASSIADKLGVVPAHPGRIRAGLSYAMKELMDHGGHTCVYRDRLIRDACKLLALHKQSIEDELLKLLDAGQFVTENADPASLSKYPELFKEETHAR